MRWIHRLLDIVPEGTPLPILTGPLRGRRWHWARPHYAGGNDPGGGRLGDHGYVTGSYERHAQNILCRFLRPGVVFWDLGAHHGFFSLLAHRLGADVVAIEGDPKSLPWLRRNCPRATVYPHYVDATTRWQDLSPPYMLKCDIDGGESEALLGLFHTYLPPVILLSTHGPIHDLFCRGLLEEYGYEWQRAHKDEMILAERRSS